MDEWQPFLELDHRAYLHMDIIIHIIHDAYAYRKAGAASMPERRFYRESRQPVGEMSWWLIFKDDHLMVEKRWTLVSDESEGNERYEVAGFFQDSTEPVAARNELRRLLSAFITAAE